jgi:competence protein ComFC
VTWIPTHWRTRLHRPLHAAEVLADHVARAMGIPAVAILRRTSAGRHQVGLTYTERIENVRGLYALRKGVSLDAARILIVDDVRTTGATLDHCARVLRRGGAAEVYGAVALKVTWVTHPTGAPLMI